MKDQKYLLSPSARRAERRDFEESTLAKVIWALVTLAGFIAMYLAWWVLT